MQNKEKNHDEIASIKQFTQPKQQINYSQPLISNYKSYSPENEKLKWHFQKLENQYNNLWIEVLNYNKSLIVKNHKVILFSLNSLDYPQLASNIGKLLIQDLKEFTSIKPRNQRINFVLDEFNVFASDSIINLINKTRSFNYQCFLSFQVTDDLSTEKKKLLNTIFGNVTNIIAHNVKNPNSAQYLAKVFGTKTSQKITKQYDTKNKKKFKGFNKRSWRIYCSSQCFKKIKSWASILQDNFRKFNSFYWQNYHRKVIIKYQEWS